MTQAASNNKAGKRVSAPVHNGRFLAKTNIRFFFVDLALHILALPLILLTVIITIGSDHTISGYNSLYVILGVVCTALGAAMGIGIAITFFRELYDKQQTDLRFSLPMSASQRFLSQYLSGLAVYLVPFVIAQIFSVILLFIGHMAFDGKTIVVESLSSNTAEPVTWYCNIFSETLIPCSIKLIFGGMIIMLMLYTIFIFAMTCCGSLFETLAYGTISEGAASVLILFFHNYVMDTKGFGMAFSGKLFDLMGCISPSGGVYGLITTLDYYSDVIVGTRKQSFAAWAVPMLIITAVFFVGALLLYRRRKAEMTGKPFAFRPFFYVILFVISACTAMMMSGFESDTKRSVVPIICGTAIVYILLEIASNRGLKNIKELGYICLRCVVIGGLGIAVYFIPICSDIFGRVYIVPAAEDVVSVDVSYGGTFGDGVPVPVNITDSTEISRIISAQRMQLDAYRFSNENKEQYFDGDDYPNDYKYTRYAYATLADNGNWYGFSVTYHLKNGKTVSRYYNQLYRGALRELEGLELCSEYKAANVKFISDYISDTVTNHKRNIEAYYDSFGGEESYYAKTNYSRDVNKDYTLEYLKKITVYASYSDDINEYSLERLPADFGERLTECLAKDIEAVTEEELYHTAAADYGTLNLPDNYLYEKIQSDAPSYRSITLKSYYTNTVDYLESVGIEFGGEKNYRLTDNCMIYRFSGENNGYPLSDLEYDAGYDITSDIVAKYYDELTEMLENAVFAYIPDGPCYTINVGGNYAYIGDEYRQTAEKIYTEAAAESENAVNAAA